MKILHVTHTDWDGKMCEYLVKRAFRYDEYDVIHIEPSELSNQLADLFQEFAEGMNAEKNPDVLIVTDLALTTYDVDMLQDIAKDYGIRVLAYDHHNSNIHKVYESCHAVYSRVEFNNSNYRIVSSINSKFHGLGSRTNELQTSAAALLWEDIYINFHNRIAYDGLLDYKFVGKEIPMNHLVLMSRLYDTYLFKKSSEDLNIVAMDKIDLFTQAASLAPKMNQLIRSLDWKVVEALFDKYIENYKKYLNVKLEEILTYNLPISAEDMLVHFQSKTEKEVQQALEEMKLIDHEGFNIAIIFLGKYSDISSIGNYILEMRKDVDIVMGIYDANLSFRSRDGEVDVSTIALAHGGGGHKASAGMQHKDREMAFFNKGLMIMLNDLDFASTAHGEYIKNKYGEK